MREPCEACQGTGEWADERNCPSCGGLGLVPAPNRFVVQRWGFGYVVAEKGKRRIATFEKRTPAERYRDALNAGTVEAFRG